ncbi:MAG TPA: transglutaminaseTgpA domain-containing protein, partial [Acidimicrobiales bacterium]|nr:transglutaminaseTgpA domain-containing protein [Acidimicrobiales bacterium]
MTLWQRVVQANRPGPAEDSIQFRVASAAAVVIAIGACWSQGELSAPMALFAMVATVVGNVLSYWRRRQPWPLVKPILAVCAIGGFVWFIVTASHNATPGDISTVEGPLATLFAWVLSTHAFDVPARRDVAYSLAGSAALMAVAAAQSVDLALGAYVVAWVGVGLWGLVAMWQSMAGARGVPWVSLGVAGVAVVVVAALLVAVLPAPKVSTSLIFPSASENSSPVDTSNNLTDGSASLPAHAASPSGHTGIGGFLGFAKSLDTGVRASLGNQVVMRVRASRPSFWVGQTYDRWDGQSWDQSAEPAKGSGVAKLQFGSPFTVPLAADQLGTLSTGSTDVQTFYLAESGPNLVFHADNAQRVYIQSRY